LQFAVCSMPGAAERASGSPAVSKKRRLRFRLHGSPSSVLGPRFLVPVLAGLLLFAGRTPAQTQPLNPVVKYYVWGQVRAPGAYQLSVNPDLVELLSAAGGPTTTADVRHIVLVRAITQTRTRIDLKKVLASGQVIQLSPGDVVMIPNSAWYVITDAISVVTVVASLATLAITFMTWARGG